MAWRNAYSLDTLIGQLNAAYPNGGWLFLGTKGDTAHQAVPSDHNPNAQGVVTALDIGPGSKLSIHDLANRLAASPHPDLKYIISNKRIAEWQYGFKWRSYSGSDPHDTHIHVSVGRGDDGYSRQPYDDRVPWNVTGQGADMPITKEQEKVAALLATGSYPGENYNYRFTGTTDYNGMLSFWEGQQQKITKEMENAVADGATGIKNVIGSGYNSPYVGKPVAGFFPQMVAFWNNQPKAGEPDATVLKPGNYKVK